MNENKSLGCLVWCFGLLLIARPTLAHEVKIHENVGGTLHIEPNDAPKAGERSLAWFALTKAGGQVIPLAQCDCKLAIYSQPHQANAAPLLQPPLKPSSAEQYKDIPSAEIVFPQVGAYALELSGKPKTEGEFEPFQLNFRVTVATAVAQPPIPEAGHASSSPTTKPEVAQRSQGDRSSKPQISNQSSLQIYGLGAIIFLAGLGAGAFWLTNRRSR